MRFPIRRDNYVQTDELSTRRASVLPLTVSIMLLAAMALPLSMAARSDARGELRLEAQALARTLALAAAEARYTGRALAWTVEDSGYRFWQLHQDSGWVELVENDVLRAHVLPEGMIISASEQASLHAADGGRVEFAAWGEIPAFAVDLRLDSARYQVTASTAGEFVAVPMSVASNTSVVLR